MFSDPAGRQWWQNKVTPLRPIYIRTRLRIGFDKTNVPAPF